MKKILPILLFIQLSCLVSSQEIDVKKNIIYADGEPCMKVD